jgi:glutathione-regulated potassium-efflux system ancillary protein KefF
LIFLVDLAARHLILRCVPGRPAVIIYSHPYPSRSRAGRALLEAVADLPGLEVRSLYALYPDFDIDVRAEQAALERSELVIWQGPLYWYGVPALLGAWFEKVLSNGWAYGENATALRGKSALWVTTTGAPASDYRPGGIHGHAFEAFVPPVSQTARFCGMNWIDPPVVLHGAHRISVDGLHEATRQYRQRLEALLAGPRDPGSPHAPGHRTQPPAPGVEPRHE